jgi:hypothetical protein
MDPVTITGKGAIFQSKRDRKTPCHNILFVCLFVLSRKSNFSAIWRLSPLPVTGLQI